MKSLAITVSLIGLAPLLASAGTILLFSTADCTLGNGINEIEQYATYASSAACLADPGGHHVGSLVSAGQPGLDIECVYSFYTDNNCTDHLLDINSQSRECACLSLGYQMNSYLVTCGIALNGTSSSLEHRTAAGLIERHSSERQVRPEQSPRELLNRLAERACPTGNDERPLLLLDHFASDQVSATVEVQSLTFSLGDTTLDSSTSVGFTTTEQARLSRVAAENIRLEVEGAPNEATATFTGNFAWGTAKVVFFGNSTSDPVSHAFGFVGEASLGVVIYHAINNLRNVTGQCWEISVVLEDTAGFGQVNGTVAGVNVTLKAADRMSDR